MLSSISKLYDPLGYLSPVIITGKVFMQKLWIKKIQWDDKFTLSLKSEFLSWYQKLVSLNSIRIPGLVSYLMLNVSCLDSVVFHKLPMQHAFI